MLINTIKEFKDLFCYLLKDELSSDSNDIYTIWRMAYVRCDPDWRKQHESELYDILKEVKRNTKKDGVYSAAQCLLEK